MVPGPAVSYPKCLVTKFSVSAFIQCADVKGLNAPQFSMTVGGEKKSVGVIQLLTAALDTVACSSCPLAENIRRAADEYNKYSRENFVKYLCNQYHPTDAGMCCLRRCLNGLQPERSIEAFCRYNVNDLMIEEAICSARVTGSSNGVSDSGTNGDSGFQNSATTNDGGVSDSGTNGDSGFQNNATTDNGGVSDSDTGSNDSSATVPSGEGDFPTSKITDSSDDSTPLTTSATRSTTSPTVDDATAINPTSTSAPQEAQGTPNEGTDSGRRATYVDRVKRFGFAVLPIIAVL